MERARQPSGQMRAPGRATVAQGSREGCPSSKPLGHGRVRPVHACGGAAACLPKGRRACRSLASCTRTLPAHGRACLSGSGNSWASNRWRCARVFRHVAFLEVRVCLVGSWPTPLLLYCKNDSFTPHTNCNALCQRLHQPLLDVGPPPHAPSRTHASAPCPHAPRPTHAPACLSCHPSLHARMHVPALGCVLGANVMLAAMVPRS